MVKRYEPYIDGGFYGPDDGYAGTAEMEECDEGEFVRFTAYEAVRAALEELADSADHFLDTSEIEEVQPDALLALTQALTAARRALESAQ